MSWITITEEDVKTRLAGAELTAFKTAALSPGQSNPLPEIISQVTDEIRGYVAACAHNTLDAAGTVPPRLLAPALNMIRYRLATRLPGMKGLIDELRQKEYNDALAVLKDVAACRFAVEDPDGDATSTTSPTPDIVVPTRRFDRCSQEGI